MLKRFLRQIMVAYGIVLICVDLSSARAAPAPAKRQPIRIYIWWDYVAKPVLDRLQAEGFDVELTPYKTNEQAIARLARNTDGFDVAVLSNLAVPALRSAGALEVSAFGDVASRRKLVPVVQDVAKDCLPYLWSATVFFYDERATKQAPQSIGDLQTLKKQGMKIGILDDMFEVAARLIGDGRSACSRPNRIGSIFDALQFCKGSPFPSDIGLAAADFRSEIVPVLREGNTAGYGWHGAHAMLKDDAPWLRSVPPKENPVVGYDAVCLLKGSKLKKSVLKRFVELLTDPRSTAENVKMSQYFSPYEGDDAGLEPRIGALFKAMLERTKEGKTILLTPPAPAEHEKLNTWWRSVRYAAP